MAEQALGALLRHRPKHAGVFLSRWLYLISTSADKAPPENISAWIVTPFLNDDYDVTTSYVIAIRDFLKVEHDAITTCVIQSENSPSEHVLL